jgi:hypothetical protein
MLLEPLHHCGMAALEIGGSGAREPTRGWLGIDDSGRRR